MEYGTILVAGHKAVPPEFLCPRLGWKLRGKPPPTVSDG